VLAFNPPAIFGLGTAGGYEFFIQNRGDGGEAAAEKWVQQFLARANSDPQLGGGADAVARHRAAALRRRRPREGEGAGVPIDELFNGAVGHARHLYVNDFNKYGRTWQVLMSAEPEYRQRPDDIGGCTCARTKGEMVPLAALVKVRHSSGRTRSTASTTCRRSR
jgi:multidrug efflux pump